MKRIIMLAIGIAFGFCVFGYAISPDFANSVNSSLNHFFDGSDFDSDSDSNYSDGENYDDGESPDDYDQNPDDDPELYYNCYNIDLSNTDIYTKSQLVYDAINLTNSALVQNGYEEYYLTYEVADFSSSSASIWIGRPSGSEVSQDMHVLLDNDDDITLGFGEIADTSDLTGRTKENTEALNQMKYYMIASMIVLATNEAGSFNDAYDWAKDRYENLIEGHSWSRNYSNVKVLIQDNLFELTVPKTDTSKS